MRYPIGTELQLLEYFDKPLFRDTARIIATAKVLGYNETTQLYNISYKIIGTTKENFMEVPEERLHLDAQSISMTSL